MAKEIKNKSNSRKGRYFANEPATRITGRMLSEFKMINDISISRMADLFCASFNAMQQYLSMGEEGIDSRVVCYLYRIYTNYPELMKEPVSIKEFFDAIGGIDTVRKTDFSLMVGLEQSAYRRFIDGDENPSKSILKTIELALAITDNDPIKAFGLIEELCNKEGLSRGFNVIDTRTWTPDPAKKGKPRRYKKKED